MEMLVCMEMPEAQYSLHAFDTESFNEYCYFSALHKSLASLKISSASASASTTYFHGTAYWEYLSLIKDIWDHI